LNQREGEVMARTTVVIWIAIAMFLAGSSPVFAQVAWVEDFESALKQASKENKFIVLDISTSW
jgi:hypothetical protein